MSSRNTSTTNMEINLFNLDQDDLIEFIRKNYTPGDVFPKDELTEWATENGFTESA